MRHFNEPMKTSFSYSENLGELLYSQQICLAITCYQSGALLFVGGEQNGEIVVDENNYGYVMGLHCDREQLHVSTFDKILSFKSGQESTDESPDILYKPDQIHDVGDIDIHEMDLDSTGRLTFVNTAYSCIAALNTYGMAEPIWTPPFITELRPENRCHLNGMCLADGIVRYATAISTADEPHGWRGRGKKTGVVMDAQSNEIVIEGLSIPHSPRLHGGSLWVLESGRGYLQKVNPVTFRREDVAFCPGFLRGLNFTGKYAIAGMSLGRKNGLEGLEINERLQQLNLQPGCGVTVVDTLAGSEIARIAFDSATKEIFSIGILKNVQHARILAFDQISAKHRPNPMTPSP